nr:AAA family ATPase [Candidatus Contubernalis alkalaceticus]
MKWAGCCPDCSKWNTFEEKEIFVTNKAKSSMKNPTRKIPVRLNGVEVSRSNRIITSISEFNRAMGGGIVRDSVTIVSAKPGAGKSTLLLQVADDIARQGFKVLYASGEESESQLKSRADRLFQSVHNNIWVLSDLSMDNVLRTIEEINADLIIIDSIQTFVSEEYPGSRAGSPVQTMECANKLVKISKGSIRPRAVIMVCQMNKSEELAGLRALEHLVDTVLIIEGENEEELRALAVLKNRFGSTWERGFFLMSDMGMLPIDNPSQVFMTKREKGDLFPGNALTVIKEGSRPIIVEIESLVSKTFLPYPSRVGECLSREQLNTVIAILEKKGGISLFDKDVVLKTTGGIKFKEQAVNLSVMMSMVSSVVNKPIPNDTVFIADVGLTGELKTVASLEIRLKEVDRLGFSKVYTAKNAVMRKLTLNNTEVIKCKTLSEVIKDIFK